MPFIAEFQKIGVEILIDNEQIFAGDSIPDKINEMMKQSDGAVLFYSAAYARKPWTTEEQHALQFQSLERSEYRLIVVRLDPIELPPLIAHRLWAQSNDAQALAAVFSPDLRKAFGEEAFGREISNWLEIFANDELERIAYAIETKLTQLPSASVVEFRSRKAGNLMIYLSQPLVDRFKDNLSFVLRALKNIDFIRTQLQEEISEEGLGKFKASFMLAVQKKIRQIEEFHQELRSTLDALVERVTLK